MVQPNIFANDALLEFSAIQETKNDKNPTSSEDVRIKKNKKRNSNKNQQEKRYKEETILPNLKIKKPETSTYD